MTSKALDKLDVYLSASQIGITVASLALGRAIEDWVEQPIAGLFVALGKLPVISHVWARLAPLLAGGFRLVGLDFERLIPGFAVGIVPVAALSLVTFLHMALGEQAPKTLAIRRRESWRWSRRLRWW